MLLKEVYTVLSLIEAPGANARPWGSFYCVTLCHQGITAENRCLKCQNKWCNVFLASCCMAYLYLEYDRCVKVHNISQTSA